MSVVDGIFAAADAVEFEVFGERVMYRPTAGTSALVWVIVASPDEVAQPFDAKVRRETVTVEVRASDVAEPAKGDALELFGEFYEVAASPQRKIHDRSIWSLDLKRKP